MKTRKNIIRFFLLLILIAGIIGISWYETKSIEQKEHDRQYTAYDDIKKDITLNLNLAKVAILTKDADLYHQSTDNIDQKLQAINNYSIVQTEQVENIQKVQDYNNFLKDHEATLREMITLNTKIKSINQSVSENFGDAKNLSRDSLRNAGTIIDGLVISTDDYHDTAVLAIVDKINQILAQMKDSASKLAGCIDSCYQERIVELSNEMSNNLGKLIEGFPEQHQAFVDEFQLDQLAELTL